MTIALRPAALPRGLVLLLLAVALLAALVLGGLSTGGRPQSDAVLPPASGPAANGLLAFESDGDIHVIRPDGTERRVLIDGPPIQSLPAWSPDGTRLAHWASATTDGPFDLIVTGADGRDEIVVASGVLELTGWGQAQWSPDGSSLLYSARTETREADACLGRGADLGEFCSSRIFRAAADGSSEPRQIGDAALDARSPAWSPDGKRIAFGGGHTRTGIALHVMDADGGDVRQVGDTDGLGWSFIRQDWSPDGSRIAAQIGIGDWAVHEWDVATGTATKLVESSVDEVAPAYAPDGALAWFSGAMRDPCCLVLREPGKEPTFLPGGIPIWSPDGRFIATTLEFMEGSVVIVDRAGEIVSVIADSTWPPSWQRVAQ